MKCLTDTIIPTPSQPCLSPVRLYESCKHTQTGSQSSCTYPQPLKNIAIHLRTTNAKSPTAVKHPCIRSPPSQTTTNKNDALEQTLQVCVGMKALTELNLSHNRISGSLPWQLGSCAKLKILHLRSNRITELPPSIADCTSLVELHAGEARGTGSGLGAGARISIRFISRGIGRDLGRLS